jgi:hypothetical protein
MPPECFEKSNRTEASQNASWYLLVFFICAAALDVLSLPQIGTTSGGEREQEDFMSMCGPSDLWKCFGRDQVLCPLFAGVACASSLDWRWMFASFLL